MKKLFCAVMLVGICVLLGSCMLPQTQGPGVGGGGDGELSYIIRSYNDEIDIDYVSIRNRYFAAADSLLHLYFDADKEEGEGELCIGATDRSVTSKAKTELEKKLRGVDADDAIGWMIYSDGSSVAIYWSDDTFAQTACEYFMTELVENGETDFSAGVIEWEAVSRLAAKKEQERIEKEAAFAAVEEQLGKEAADALRNHYSIYDERYYIWLAHLYDPGVGGFYYSNSALQTEGYLPDLESTKQAVGHFSSMGMLEKRGGIKAFPDWMKEQMIAFARELQDPVDGYFYHPQWGKNIGVGRLSRDLSWATSIVTGFGGKIKWNAPNGTKGEYGMPPEATALTSQLCGGSTVTAVSSAIKSVASLSVNQFPQRLRTVEAWREYIVCELNGNADPSDTTPNKIRTNSYSIGHNIGAQTGQINQRDQLAIELGELPDENGDGIADGGYVETVEELFNGWYLDYNGLWEHSKSIDPETGKPVDDPENGETYYNAINGLMKTSGAYNSLKIKIPNAEASLESAIYMVNYVNAEFGGDPGADVMGKQPNGSVDVYNPWVAINNLFTNINKYGDKSVTERVRATIRENAAEMIRATTAKTVNFKKDDGSFGYTWNYSPANSQGAPVAVPNTVEGDVNGGGIAVTGITGNMCSGLGITKPPMFGDSDWEVCLDIFESLSPVQKTPIILPDPEPVTFDGYDEGTNSSDVDEISTSLQSGYAEIVSAMPGTDGSYGEADGKVIKLVAQTTGKGDTLTFTPFGSGKSCNVLEFDICIEECNEKTTLFQINMGSCYRLTLMSDGDTIYIGDDNKLTEKDTKISRKLGPTFAKGEWHRIRVEYYIGSAEEVRTKIYLDGELVAVSDNYVGRNDTLDTPVDPSSAYKSVGFYSLNPCLQTVYFDNVFAAKTDDIYVEEEIVSPD